MTQIESQGGAEQESSQPVTSDPTGIWGQIEHAAERTWTAETEGGGLGGDGGDG
jgi:hypothetical protein